MSAGADRPGPPAVSHPVGPGQAALTQTGLYIFYWPRGNQLFVNWLIVNQADELESTSSLQSRASSTNSSVKEKSLSQNSLPS